MENTGRDRADLHGEVPRLSDRQGILFDADLTIHCQNTKANPQKDKKSATEITGRERDPIDPPRLFLDLPDIAH